MNAQRSDTVAWPDAVTDVVGGDLVTACATATRFGGTNLFPVCTLGAHDPDAGTISMTSPLALGQKLDHLRVNPRMAMAFFSRAHGFATSPSYVLVQGDAEVGEPPTCAPLGDLRDDWERFLGPLPEGRFGRWALREYVERRVPITLGVRRIVMWDDLVATGAPRVIGPAFDAEATGHDPLRQIRPARWAKRRADRQLQRGPDHLVSYLGDDGYPVVLPVPGTTADDDGLVLTRHDLPVGGRRASFISFWFAAQLRGQGALQVRGWLDAADGGTATLRPTALSRFNLPGGSVAPKLIVPLAVKAKHHRLRRRGLIVDTCWVGDPERPRR